MMSRIKQGLLVAIAGAAIAVSAGVANAADYNFSYTFDTGAVVTGSFSGAGPITDITDISNISAKIDGTPLVGPLFAYSNSDTLGDGKTCGAGSCYSSTGAVISSIANDNNFVLANGSSTSLNGFTNDFYIIPWNNGGTNIVATQSINSGGIIDYYNGNFKAANWSVSAAPEPATWAMMMIGLGGVGATMRMARRKNEAAVVPA